MTLQAAPQRHGGRIALGVALVAGVAAGLFVLAAIPAVLREWRDADYPGASRLSDHSTYTLGHFSYRRDTAYRTKDLFPVVYNWYSSGHKLGPEEHAQSNCITMERTFREFFVIDRYMGVTLCDTRNGRMIFVTRTIELRR
jgi:hypothetical protein